MNTLALSPYDPITDTIVIEGTRYSADFFRNLGCNFPAMVGQVLRVDKKEDGVVTVTRLEKYEFGVARITILEEALRQYIRAGCCEGTHFVNQKAALDNALEVLGE